jgi:uncharacterized protein (TIGR03067 family)
MRKLASLVTLAAAVICLAFQGSSPGDEDEAVKKELAKLQGEWKMVSGVADGYPVPEEMLSSAKRVCKGDELTVTIGSELIMKAKITLDPSKSPKTIDYQSRGRPKGKSIWGFMRWTEIRLNRASLRRAPSGPRNLAAKRGIN